MMKPAPPSYAELLAVRPRLEEALGVWMTPTLGFEITPNKPDAEFPGLKQVFDGYRDVMAQHAAEVRDFIFSQKLESVPHQKIDEVSPYWGAPYFPPGDARLAYAVVARYRPSTLIEIGCGNSTKFMRRAIEDYRTATRLICIDPAPRAEIADVADEIHRASVTAVDTAIFACLGAGDVLFIDGSHLVMNGSDCVHLFLNVLPSLPPGAWVHLHDIFLPYDYSNDLHISCRYNEQYLLATLFLFSRDWIPVLPIYYAHKMGILPHSGGSFWMRRVAAGDREVGFRDALDRKASSTPAPIAEPTGAAKGVLTLSQYVEGLPEVDGIRVISSQSYAFDEPQYDSQYGYSASTISALAGSLTGLFSSLELPRGGACLELGCGTGVLSLALSRSARFESLILTDPSPAFLKITRRRLSDEPPELQLSFVAMSADDFGKLPAGSLRAVFLRYTLHRIYDWLGFLARASTVLSPGGVLVFEEPFAEGFLMQAALIHFFRPTGEKEKGYPRDDAWYVAYLKESVSRYLLDSPLKPQQEDKHLFVAHEIMTAAQECGLHFRFFPNQGLDGFPLHSRKDEFLQMLLHNCRVNLQFPPRLVDRLRERFTPVSTYLDSATAEHECCYAKGTFVLTRPRS